MKSFLTDRLSGLSRKTNSSSACEPADNIRVVTADGESLSIQSLLIASRESSDFLAILGADGCNSLAGLDDGYFSQISCEFEQATQFAQRLNVQDRVPFLTGVSQCIHGNEAQTLHVRMLSQAGSVTGTAYPCDVELRLSKISIEHQLKTEAALLLVGRDISSLMGEKRSLQQRSDDFEKADLAKTRFLANMSHELRTPLNAIIGFSELLNSKMMMNVEPSKREEYVNIIHDSARHLLSVLNDILDMSKIEAGKYQLLPEPFELAGVIDASVAMLAVSAETGGLSIIRQIAEDLPLITADQRAVKQMLLNLLSNAIKFSPAGGTVRITANRQGRKLVLAIEDQGPGLLKDQLARLGEPFFQADDAYSKEHEGTGLGLSVVLGLAKLHGGDVNFESEPGEGLRVEVTLPISGADAPLIPADGTTDIVSIHPNTWENRNALDTEESLEKIEWAV